MFEFGREEVHVVCYGQVLGDRDLEYERLTGDYPEPECFAQQGYDPVEESIEDELGIPVVDGGGERHVVHYESEGYRYWGGLE